jgi:hypothetical protein
MKETKVKKTGHGADTKTFGGVYFIFFHLNLYIRCVPIPQNRSIHLANSLRKGLSTSRYSAVDVHEEHTEENK